MPFGNGFNWGDLNTYSWKEHAILAAALFLIVLLFIVIPLMKAKRNKQAKKIIVESTVGSKKRIIFKDNDGDSVMFAGPNAWYIDNTGKTELYRAVEGNEVNYVGKAIFGSKEVKKVQITQEDDNFVKHSSMERHYITFDFVSQDEVRLGSRIFLTEREILRRLEQKRKQEAIEAKALAKQNKLDEKRQEKLSKAEKKREAKAQKRTAKLAKKEKSTTEEISN
ncbi:hypothetical protein [Acholeplasma hippikon]|uniref:Uncharacterized protein n=1 Tax=Acholeplasma hippikon TaxID=264636 RepID=A0A449BKH3_9MOLU|nr:hypothetical protein [Acholeplasma hippikon]VEU82949.1 Uncharacterised protein [Acholeplasma hippikon]